MKQLLNTLALQTFIVFIVAVASCSPPQTGGVASQGNVEPQLKNDDQVMTGRGMAQSAGRDITIEAVPKERYAVLIGINDYEKLTPLNYARNDVMAIRDQLYKIGFERQNVETLVCGGTTQRPTKSNITTAIQRIASRAKEGDILFVALSGHGLRTADDNQDWFCSIEADRENLRTTAVSINDIYRTLDGSKATFKLMMVDACRNVPVARSVSKAKAIDTLVDPPKGIALLQSCSAGEQSWETHDIKHGIFSYYVVEGLSGKAANAEGRVTLLGLAEYVDEKTRRGALDLAKSQRPYLKGAFTNFDIAKVANMASPLPEQNRPERHEPLPSGVVDFEAELQKSGFRGSGTLSGLGGPLQDFVMYGNIRLRDRLREEERNLQRASPFEKADAQARVDAVKREIASAQAAIAQKTFYGEYTYRTRNVQVYGNESSFTMSISPGFSTQRVAAVSFPVRDVTGRMATVRMAVAGISLSVDGTTNSIRALVDNNNSYRARMVFTNLRQESARVVSANVLSIEIIKVEGGAALEIPSSSPRSSAIPSPPTARDRQPASNNRTFHP
jgi:hypothetical protein